MPFVTGMGAIPFLLTEGQASDYKRATILQDLLPAKNIFPTDSGYDTEWLREFLKARGMEVCILPEKMGIKTFLLTRCRMGVGIFLKTYSAS